MANPVKLQVIVERVVSHGDGVYELILVPLGRVPRYKAGQFLHLSVDDYDPSGGFWPESRVFSIASSFGTKDIEVVYSVKGAYTRKMEESISPGKTLWVKLPYGEFHIDAECGRDVVLIAGGTGVSPFIPLIRELSGRGDMDSRIMLFYGVRKKGQLLFMDAISECSAKRPGFGCEIFAEEDAGDPAIRIGTLDIDRIRAETTGLANPLYYLSGPPAMIKKFMARLIELGVGRDDVKIDEWE
jgi:NAD(P)H-flavin reductase